MYIRRRFIGTVSAEGYTAATRVVPGPLTEARVHSAVRVGKPSEVPLKRATYRVPRSGGKCGTKRNVSPSTR
jgi:hypothetical protein